MISIYVCVVLETTSALPSSRDGQQLLGGNVKITVDEVVAAAVCSYDVQSSASGNIYLSGDQCSPTYIVCQQNTALSIGFCPQNTLFDRSRQACYDLPLYGACSSTTGGGLGTLSYTSPAVDTTDDFITTDTKNNHINGFDNNDLSPGEPSDLWPSTAASGDRDRRQIKFLVLQEGDGDAADLDSAGKWRRTTASHNSVGDRHLPEMVDHFISGSLYYNRQPRQIKFRSIDGMGRRHVVNAEKLVTRRQIKFDSFVHPQLESIVREPSSAVGYL
jgi:hypothetical protein